jgi:hypothetical protein
MDSTVAPFLLTAAWVLVLPLDEALTGEPGAAVIQAVTWVVVGIPLWNAVWVYLTLQLGPTGWAAGTSPCRATAATGASGCGRWAGWRSPASGC